MDDFIDFFIPFLLIVLLVGGSIFGVAYAVDRFQCAGFEKATGYLVQYAGLNCYALIDGKWVPKDYVFGKKINANVNAKVSP